MSKVDAVHAPVVPFLTPTIAETDVRGGANMNELLALVTRLMRPVNYVGLPSLAVPCGFQPHGLLYGFQPIVRPFDDGSSRFARVTPISARPTGTHARLDG